MDGSPTSTALLGLLPLRTPRPLGGLSDRLTTRWLTRGLQDCHVTVFSRPTLLQTSRLVFGLRQGDRSVLIKYPRNAQAAASLEREWDVLQRLAADQRLERCRHLLPRALGPRPRPSAPGMAQDWLPGAPAGSPSPDRPQELRRISSAALAFLAELRRTTGQRLPAAERVDHWVRAQLVVLAEQVGWCRTAAGGAGLEAFRLRLETSLGPAWLTQAWTHADFHTGNLLLDSAREHVTGVFDWGNAAAEGPSEVDACTFVLSQRSALTGRSFGELVADALRTGGLPDADRELLDSAGVDLDECGGPTALPLLTWLWHVAGNVWETPQFGRSRWWVAHIVVPVLHEASRWRRDRW